MKRFLVFTALLLLCFGGCHKSQELHIDAPIQAKMCSEYCTGVGESLQNKREEFEAKFFELQRLVRQNKIKRDTIEALPSWYPITQ